MGDRLFAEVDNPGAGRRVVLVHGFTQTRDCWGALPDRLVAANHEVVRVDLPGHGRSGHADADLWDAADLVADVGGRATYLGYSLGARVCLHLALRHADVLEALVLEGGTPGIRDDADRAARRHEDDGRARHVEEVGVVAFLDEWLDQPLFAGLPASNRCLEARRENTAAGLAASLRACGTGRQDPLWDRLAEIAAPVLCVTGAQDATFTALGEAMVAAIGTNAATVVVADAGHTVHLERPDAFWQAIEPFLASGDDRLSC